MDLEILIPICPGCKNKALLTDKVICFGTPGSLTKYKCPECFWSGYNPIYIYMGDRYHLS